MLTADFCSTVGIPARSAGSGGVEHDC